MSRPHKRMNIVNCPRCHQGDCRIWHVAVAQRGMTTHIDHQKTEVTEECEAPVRSGYIVSIFATCPSGHAFVIDIRQHGGSLCAGFEDLEQNVPPVRQLELARVEDVELVN